MNKLLQDYENKFNGVPNDMYDRFIYLIDKYKITYKDIEKIRVEVNKIRNKQYKRINFIFFIEPSATPRPRLNFSKFFKKSGKNFVFVKGAKDHKDIFDEFMELYGEAYELIVTPTKMYVEIFSPIPSGMTKIEKILAELKLISNISRPDYDNFAKRYSDMIQCNLIYEDSQIVDYGIRKKYSAKPRIEISLLYLEDFDCKYNKRKMEKRLEK